MATAELAIAGAVTVGAPGNALAPGKSAQRAVRAAGPGSGPESADAIPQWCAPARRQQAGRFDSGPAKAKGAVSENRIAVNSEIADARRAAIQVHYAAKIRSGKVNFFERVNARV